MALQERMQREEERSLLTRLRMSVALGVPLFLLAQWEMFAGSARMPFSPYVGALLQLHLATPIQFYAGSRFYRGAWATAKHGTTDMNTLVALGSKPPIGRLADVIASRFVPVAMGFSSVTVVSNALRLRRFSA